MLAICHREASMSPDDPPACRGVVPGILIGSSFAVDGPPSRRTALVAVMPSVHEANLADACEPIFRNDAVNGIAQQIHRRGI